ncbi:Bgt-55118 [Blumeria graminis f. sp. tritici]|uniref:Bgt-55118 n=1 Tax=Blumeria graminis f. sp. tritici TaxID=62690 RepID=A0A9X9MFH9_BLUGR|nr:Bgt-55118 [Blumeria graminis f. sp. tritici]
MAIYKMAKACSGSRRFFLFSIWWMLTVEGRLKVPSTKVSSGISECILYISSPNVKLSYRRI